MTDKDVEPRRMYVCGACGTLAHCNSGKKIDGSIPRSLKHELKRPDHELHGRVNPHSGVVMTPPCPCGNDLFNVIEVLQVHHEDVADMRALKVAADST